MKAHHGQCRAKLVVVSHRLPTTYNATTETWEQSPGGLAAAVASGLSGRAGIWLGHATVQQPPPPRHMPGNPDMALAGVALPPDVADLAISGFANRTLWPALHGLRSHVETNPAWEASYHQMSNIVAGRIARLAASRAIVWLHDFHNFAVALPLRRLRPDVSVRLFCHTPMHSTLADLPGADMLKASLGACHQIGVQRTSDAVSLGHMLGDAGPELVVSPVAVAHDRWSELRGSSAIRSAADRMRCRGTGSHLVGVDRMDYTKGIAHRILALERLLGSGTVAPDDLRLTQVAIPTRPGVPLYARLAAHVQQLAARVNRRFRRSDRCPVIDLRTTPMTPEEVAVVLRSGDVGIVNPARDGFNLVAAEFSVINADRPCSLVLSRGAGVSEIIGDASLTVDGDDVSSVATAMRTAVSSSPRASSQLAARRAALLGSHTPASWAAANLAPLPTDRGDPQTCVPQLIS